MLPPPYLSSSTKQQFDDEEEEELEVIGEEEGARPRTKKIGGWVEASSPSSSSIRHTVATPQFVGGSSPSAIFSPLMKDEDEGMGEEKNEEQLYAFLENKLGRAGLEEALALLRAQGAAESEQDNSSGGGGGAEDEELAKFLANIERVIGIDGLVFLDDLMFLALRG